MDLLTALEEMKGVRVPRVRKGILEFFKEGARKE
jgi:hypothetical protein